MAVSKKRKCKKTGKVVMRKGRNIKFAQFGINERIKELYALKGGNHPTWEVELSSLLQALNNFRLSRGETYKAKGESKVGLLEHRGKTVLISGTVIDVRVDEKSGIPSVCLGLPELHVTLPKSVDSYIAEKHPELREGGSIDRWLDDHGCSKIRAHCFASHAWVSLKGARFVDGLPPRVFLGTTLMLLTEVVEYKGRVGTSHLSRVSKLGFGKTVVLGDAVLAMRGSENEKKLKQNMTTSRLGTQTVTFKVGAVYSTSKFREEFAIVRWEQDEEGHLRTIFNQELYDYLSGSDEATMLELSKRLVYKYDKKLHDSLLKVKQTLAMNQYQTTPTGDYYKTLEDVKAEGVIL